MCSEYHVHLLSLMHTEMTMSVTGLAVVLEVMFIVVRLLTIQVVNPKIKILFLCVSSYQSVSRRSMYRDDTIGMTQVKSHRKKLGENP